jgi:L-malate glycosyltransferase
LETIRRIDKERFSIHLVCLWESSWMKTNPLPYPIIKLGYRGLTKPNLPIVLYRLRKVLKENRIQLLQTFFWDSLFVAFLTKLLYPKIAVISCRRDIGLGQTRMPWYHDLYGLALPIVNKTFTGVLCNSENVRRHVVQKERISPDKVSIIRNGIELITGSSVCPEVFRDGAKKVWITLAASMTPVKRIDILLLAAALLKNRGHGDSIGVLLLGDGPLRPLLERMCVELGIDQMVSFIGSVKNVGEYISRCDICVLCSDAEGLSNSILEYMACGKPIIATAVGGNSELVDDRNGIMVPPGNAAAVADALEHLIQNEAERARMGMASTRILQESYSWQRTIGQLQHYYCDIVGK